MVRKFPGSALQRVMMAELEVESLAESIHRVQVRGMKPAEVLRDFREPRVVDAAGGGKKGVDEIDFETGDEGDCGPCTA